MKKYIESFKHFDKWGLSEQDSEVINDKRQLF